MPALTKTQLDHAKQRVADHHQKFVTARLKLLGDKPGKIAFSFDEKAALIRAGRATLRENAHARTDLEDAFEFVLTPEQLAQQAAYDAWQTKANAVTAEANTIEAGLIDELVMSPDGVSALQRIAAAFSA